MIMVHHLPPCKSFGDVGGYEVEVRRVELNVLVELLRDVTEVSQYMNGCWAMLESLEFTYDGCFTIFVSLMNMKRLTTSNFCQNLC
jgi:hypothetical protein